MTVQMNPYLSFRGDARAAMELYQDVFGGDLQLNTFGEYNAAEDPVDAEKVMHARLAAPGGFLLMASDVPQAMEPPTTAPSACPATMPSGCTVIGIGSATAARSRCRSRNRCGVTSSAC
jgi:uncharacterized glyoxalase superfamily protein PhnB